MMNDALRRKGWVGNPSLLTTQELAFHLVTYRLQAERLALVYADLPSGWTPERHRAYSRVHQAHETVCRLHAELKRRWRKRKARR